MTKPLKPIKLTIKDIKGIVGDSGPVVQAGEEETVIPDDELADILAKAKADYEHLCRALELHPVPLDIYCPSKKSDEKTLLGTQIKNFTPGFNPKAIILPIVPGTINHTKEQAFPFPPSTWDSIRPEWPRWRLDLWHETLHQIENDVLNSWDGSNEKHGESYMRAIDYAVSKIRTLKLITHRDLRLLALNA